MFNGVEVRGIRGPVDGLNPILLKAISHFVCSIDRIAQTTEVTMRSSEERTGLYSISLWDGSCRLDHFSCILSLIIADSHLIRYSSPLAGHEVHWCIFIDSRITEHIAALTHLERPMQ